MTGDDPSSEQSINVLIEAAKPTDFDEILSLQKTVSGSDLDMRTFNEALQRGDCVVARENGKIAGFALVGTWFFGRPFLSLIAVSADRRRSGIATKLIGHVLTRSRYGLFTSTNRTNVAGQRLFEKLGFERSGIVENIDEGDPELVYYKKP